MMRTERPAAFRTLARPACRWQRAHSTHGVRPDTKTGLRSDHTPPTVENIPAAETHTAGPALCDSARAQRSPNASPPIDTAALQSRLKEWGVLASASMRRHTDHLSNRARTTLSQLGLHLNRVTGYEEIEALKRRVVEQEARIQATRRATREAKTAYDDAVLQRSASQRQVNDLLQRKSSWTDTDVGNFTSLVRSDHVLEQAEARAKVRVAETEDEADREFSALMRAILARYHEEQVWSDKIRSASTYGSLAVLGVNVVVFVAAIIIVEPWKRKRLAQTFERKVEEMSVETKVLIDAGAARLEERLAGHEKLLNELITQVSAEARRGALVTATTPREAPSEEIPSVPPPPSPWWFIHPDPSVIQGRELMLVVGSAAVGGVITVLARSLFLH